MHPVGVPFDAEEAQPAGAQQGRLVGQHEQAAGVAAQVLGRVEAG
ncbi:hypothetical protein ACTMTI_03440 [Nonomuraea sp. H19]